MSNHYTNRQIAAWLREDAQAAREHENGEATVAATHRHGPIRPDHISLLRLAADRLPFDLDDLPTAPARRSDPATSKSALRALTGSNACGKLAFAFWRAKHQYRYDGISTEAAVRMADLERLACPWKRVSDLKAAGFVRPTGETTIGRHGAEVELLEITEAGAAEVERVFAGDQRVIDRVGQEVSR